MPVLFCMLQQQGCCCPCHRHQQELCQVANHRSVSMSCCRKGCSPRERSLQGAFRRGLRSLCVPASVRQAPMAWLTCTSGIGAAPLSPLRSPSSSFAKISSPAFRSSCSSSPQMQSPCTAPNHSSLHPFQLSLFLVLRLGGLYATPKFCRHARYTIAQAAWTSPQLADMV